MPFPSRKDVVEKTCHVCRKWFWTDGLSAKYCSEFCHFAKFLVIDDGCWSWSGVKHSYGYGLLDNGKHSRQFIHRFSYRLFKGNIPEGMLVCHHCDNPICCKPSHLFLGTAADNTADMMRKKRGGWKPCPGELNGFAKLTETQVAAILKDSRFNRHIAADYGVSTSAVDAVKSGQNWKHVPRPHEKSQRHGNSKLTEAEIKTIRSSKDTVTSLAAKYFVTRKPFGLSSLAVVGNILPNL